LRKENTCEISFETTLDVSFAGFESGRVAGGSPSSLPRLCNAANMNAIKLLINARVFQFFSAALSADRMEIESSFASFKSEGEIDCKNDEVAALATEQRMFD
jgi:hypothetical protein